MILGGGCSGLSLAVELAGRGYAGRVLIVEPRKDYARDRLWCYWSLWPHSFQDCVTHRWTTWSVRLGEREARQSTHAYAYERIPADRFYASALRCLAAVPTMALWRETRAGRVSATSSGFEVETTRGPVRAPILLDARPPAPAFGPPVLTQHFLGWHVRVQEPLFDPSCVTLMDFWTDQAGGGAFCYVLPYSPTEALVETTRLSSEPFGDRERDERWLRDYLATRLGAERYAILDRERGAIPMGLPIATRSRWPAGYHPIGTRAGLVRPSTGYAFLAIQRWSQAFAAALVASGPEAIPARPYSALSGWVDGIFLQRLRDEPATTAATFFAIFDQVEADATVRFLSDRGSLGDYFDVIAALPTWPFLKTAVRRALTSRLRPTDDPCWIGAAPPQSEREPYDHVSDPR
nr:lycopene cyclase family protein [Thiocystis violacea]